jgi:predicted Zn finger-like uncharacterized protein
MVLICPKCEARLRMDEAKLPTHPFSVRCPKCQTSVDVQPHSFAGGESAAPPETVSAHTAVGFERPVAAPMFNAKRADESAPAINQGTLSGLDEIARVLAQALRSAEGASDSGRGRKRTAWDRRRVLVCASPAYREAIAQLLVAQDYDVFVAENMAEGLGRMREERMDIVILDANFDPLEQGVAFITREVRLMRPSERRRLFFVYLTAGVRTMDPHAAFLQNVNLVVNPSDVEQLPEALELSIRHYNELYRAFNRALDLAPL